MKELSATLSDREWDVVGAALGDRPFKEVANILSKMAAQFAAQQGVQNGGDNGRGPDQPSGVYPIRPGGKSEGDPVSGD